MVNSLSQAALGRLLGLSPPAITKLKGQGMPVDSAEAAQAWRDSRQNIARRKPLPGSLLSAAVPRKEPPPRDPPGDPGDEETHEETHAQARTRREIAEATLAELKMMELRGDLIRRATVQYAEEKKATAIKESLLQLPSQLAPVVAAEGDIGKCQDLLMDAVMTVLTKISHAQ